MSTNYPHSHQKWDLASEDFTATSGCIISFPSSDKSKLGISSVPNSLPSLVLPQEIHSLRPQGPLPFEGYSNRSLGNAENYPSSMKGCTSTHSTMTGSHLEKIHNASTSEYFHQNTNRHIPYIYPGLPCHPPSSTPVYRPISTIFNTLPQMISQSSVDIGPYHSSVSFPVAKVEDLKEHQPPASALSSTQNKRLKVEFFTYPENQQSPKTEYGSFDTPKTHHLDMSSEKSNLLQNSNISPQISTLLVRICSTNSSGVLVDILKECHQYITLEEFYLLLYNASASLDKLSIVQEPGNETPHFDSLNPPALNNFVSILKALKSSQLTSGFLRYVSIQKLQMPATKFKGILRTLLAIKIIFMSVKRAEVMSIGHFSVSRGSIYKLYYILCQRLLLKYPDISDCHGLSNTLTLGQSSIGKIINLVYPNMTTKRLGKRGESKPYYMGLSLNYSVIDQDMRRLLELEMPQLREYFTIVKYSGASKDFGLADRKSQYFQETTFAKQPVEISGTLAGKLG